MKTQTNDGKEIIQITEQRIKTKKTKKTNMNKQKRKKVSIKTKINNKKGERYRKAVTSASVPRRSISRKKGLLTKTRNNERETSSDNPHEPIETNKIVSQERSK